jgi:hypothetical protein
MKYIVPELLDRIKEKYEDDPDKPISMYKLVLQSYFGDSPVCSIKEEHVLEYDYLCVMMFDLDVTGWVVVNFKDSLENFTSPNDMYDTFGFILVTITLCRKL